MNIQNIDKVIARLKRAKDQQFNMTEWLHKETECGTVGCIAGWSLATIRPDINSIDDLQNGDISFTAANILGLNVRQSYILFTPEGQLVEREMNKIREREGIRPIDMNEDACDCDEFTFFYSRVTRQVAIKMLEAVKRTGDVTYDLWAEVFFNHVQKEKRA